MAFAPLVFDIEVDSSNRLIVAPLHLKVTFITTRRGGDVIIVTIYFCVPHLKKFDPTNIYFL